MVINMLLFKGIIIGIGKIIPGVSGSMLAVSMGLYENLIYSVNNFFDNPKKNFKFLFKIGIGIILSIIFFSNIILLLLNRYYLITVFLFIGLILGSIDEIRSKTIKKNNYITIVVCIIITILGFININNEVSINQPFIKFIYYFFAGIIDAITMVVPGISGTASLMMYGCYEDIINCYSNILNMNYLSNNLSILIPFIIGMILGILLTIKIIGYLFKKKKDKTYSAIYGFCLSTIIIMVVNCLNSKYSFIQLLISFVVMFIGFIFIKKINHYLSND